MISELHKDEVISVKGAGACVCEGKSTQYTCGCLCWPKPANQVTSKQKTVPSAEVCRSDCCASGWINTGGISCDGYPYYTATNYIYDGQRYDC